MKREEWPVSASKAGIRASEANEIKLPEKVQIPNVTHLYFTVQRVQNDLDVKIGPYDAKLKRKQVLVLAKAIRDYLVETKTEEVRE